MTRPTIYSEDEIILIHKASMIVADCHNIVKKMSVPGITTKQIDESVSERIKASGGKSPFKGYKNNQLPPFPSDTCTSVNDVIVHGIPDDIPLMKGDLLSVDIGVELNGYIGDSAWTYAIGDIDEAAEELMKVGEKSLRSGINSIGVRTSLMCLIRSISKTIDESRFSAIVEYAGHGVGKNLHEPPPICNHIPSSSALRKDLNNIFLKPGMVVAIEPMVNEGSRLIKQDNEWPVRTLDGMRSVHFEHTVAITKNGPKVLTLKDWEDSY